MKNAKRSVIITAILAIIMCASLAAGATFALFSSSSSVNIAITSANVEVNADVKVTKTWHEDNNVEKAGLYDTGKAEVTYENNQAKLTLSNFVPTDGVKLAVSLKNESTVKIKYRVLLLADRTVGTELLDELDIVMNGMEFRGYTLATEYVELEAGASINDIPVTIVFPKEATEGKNTTCNLAIKVDAQQGNAVADNTFDVAEGHTIISETAEDGSVWYSEVDNKTLFAEINNGAKLAGNLTLTEDVDLDTTLVVADNTSVEITSDKTVSNANDLWNKDTGMWSLVSARGENSVTTINGGEWNAKENDCYAVDVQNGAKVVINDGTFIGNIHSVYVTDGIAEINGGFFSVQQKYPDASKANEFVLNCLDANHANGTANIIVKGGTFVNFNPADCYAEGAGTNFVADGYTVVSETKDNGEVWYTVVKAVKDAESFASLLTEGGDVALTENVSLIHTDYDTKQRTLFPYITLNKDVTLNLAGKKLTIDESVWETDNGQASLLMMAVAGGTLTINGDGELNCEDGNNQVYGINVNGGKVVINGGNYYGAMTAIQVQKGSLEINGGFFDMAPTCKTAVPQYAKYVVNCIDAAYKDGTATISIKGGTFVNFNPADNKAEGEHTNFVAEGYQVVSETKDNGDVWYTVVKV